MTEIDWRTVAGVVVGVLIGAGTAAFLQGILAQTSWRMRRRLARWATRGHEPILLGLSAFLGVALAEDLGTALLDRKPTFFLVKYALAGALVLARWIQLRWVRRQLWYGEALA